MLGGGRLAAPASRRAWSRIGWLAIAAIGLAAAPLVLAAAPTIGIVDKAFDPSTATITAGDAVTWQNRGALQHTVTADDRSFDSGPLDPGNQFANVFDHAGTFTYHCSIHAEMKGKVIVLASAVTPTPASQGPTPPPGTLPPNFSPRPVVTEPPTPVPTSSAAPAPSPAPGSSSSGAFGTMRAVVVVIAAVALVLALAARRRRGPEPRSRR